MEYARLEETDSLVTALYFSPHKVVYIYSFIDLFI